LTIGHDIIGEPIDADVLKRALANTGISFDWRPSEEQRSRIANIFVKAEADPSGRIRGGQHSVIDDSDINLSCHSRAVVGATIPSIVGNRMVYVSGESEHQCAPGGGAIAAIVNVGSGIPANGGSE